MRPEAFVRHTADVQPTTDVCGLIRPLSTFEDLADGNVSHVAMNRPSAPHYHTKTTEFYYVAFGSGTLVLGFDIISVRMGTLVKIPPYVAHYCIPHRFLELVVFAVPAWSREDEIVLPVGLATSNYSPILYKNQLIEELLRRANLAIWPGMTEVGRLEREKAREALEKKEGWNTMGANELADLLKVS